MGRSKDDFADHMNKGGFDAPASANMSIEEAIRILNGAGYTLTPPAVSDDTN